MAINYYSRHSWFSSNSGLDTATQNFRTLNEIRYDFQVALLHLYFSEKYFFVYLMKCDNMCSQMAMFDLKKLDCNKC